MRARTAGRQRRQGGVLMIAMVIMVAVAFMAAQGVRLMMLANTAHNQRWRAAQMHELLELARWRLADQARAETFTMEVATHSGLPARMAQVTIDKPTNSDADWRIIIRFPYNQPNEMTVTWESPR